MSLGTGAGSGGRKNPGIVGTHGAVVGDDKNIVRLKDDFRLAPCSVDLTSGRM